MINKKTIVCLLTARAGSKGLSNKNILNFAGKPLIAWSIEAAKKSLYVDDIFCSTDDKNIANIAKQYGAEVPFMRPKALATDSASGNDVVLHAIQNFKKKYDIILLLQPTSPLRDENDIDDAIDFFFMKKAHSLVSVSKATKPIEWNFYLKKNKLFNVFSKSNQLQISNRQEFGEVYIPNGAIYIASINGFIKDKSFYTDETFGYEMPYEKSIDIDSNYDFFLAENIKQNSIKNYTID